MIIAYEDSNIIIVQKEAGQLTQSGKSFDLDLTSEVLSYRRKKGEDVYAAVINRLDRPVSGLVLFAKNKMEAARLSKQMQQGGFCKQYYAIVCGKLSEQSGVFVDYLVKDAASNTSRIADKNEKDARRAELKYEVVEEYQEQNSTFSLVRIQLITGRHHQIRVQFASRNMPILGDGKYGDPEIMQYRRDEIMQRIKLKRGEIALCAYSLTVDGKMYTIKPHWK